MSINEYIQSGAIEACILGVATPEEITMYETMRNQNSEVKDYANNFEQKLEEQLTANVVALPNANIKDKLLQKISTAEKQTPVISISKNKPSYKLQYWVAACLAISFGSILFSITMASKLKDQQAKIETLKQENDKANNNFSFLKDPEITPVALNGVGYHAICRCSLFWDKNKQEIFVQVHHLMNIDESKTYQLWAVIDGKNVSLGTFALNADKSPIKLGKIPGGVTAFLVTMENKGGAMVPNSDIILKGIVTI